jgi:hypothetical protein
MHLTQTIHAAFVAAGIIFFSLSLAAETSAQRYPHLRERLKRGQEIVGTLSALNPKQADEFDVTSFGKEIVEFVGGGAPPGATNDLLIEGGYYLRVVNPQNKDLRPHSVLWEVHVRGKILHVFPKNKIIVIEVQEKDWNVLQTQ